MQKAKTTKIDTSTTQLKPNKSKYLSGSFIYFIVIVAVLLVSGASLIYSLTAGKIDYQTNDKSANADLKQSFFSRNNLDYPDFLEQLSWDYLHKKVVDQIKSSFNLPESFSFANLLNQKSSPKSQENLDKENLEIEFIDENQDFDSAEYFFSTKSGDIVIETSIKSTTTKSNMDSDRDSNYSIMPDRGLSAPQPTSGCSHREMKLPDSSVKSGCYTSSQLYEINSAQLQLSSARSQLDFARKNLSSLQDMQSRSPNPDFLQGSIDSARERISSLENQLGDLESRVYNLIQKGN